jgi:hypothetical protein
VDSSVRTALRSWLRTGRTPAFSAAARYLALVPNTVTRSCCAMSNSSAGRTNGAPSYSTSVQPTASALASQFHIIQPVVVK